MNKVFFLILSCIVAQGSVNAMERTYPLHDAAGRGDLELVKALLLSGADVNSQDNIGHTPLSLATLRGHQKTVQLLLDSGANVDHQSKTGKTPLHTAAICGHLEIVKILLDHGADVNKRDHYHWSALYYAIEEGHQTIAQLIQEWPHTRRQRAIEATHAAIEEIDTLTMALHQRVGEDSPANLMSQYLFQDICSYLRPSIHIDDQQAVKDYKRTYRKQQQSQSQSGCIIS